MRDKAKVTNGASQRFRRPGSPIAVPPGASRFRLKPGTTNAAGQYSLDRSRSRETVADQYHDFRFATLCEHDFSIAG